MLSQLMSHLAKAIIDYLYELIQNEIKLYSQTLFENVKSI